MDPTSTNTPFAYILEKKEVIGFLIQYMEALQFYTFTLRFQRGRISTNANDILQKVFFIIKRYRRAIKTHTSY